MELSDQPVKTPAHDPPAWYEEFAIASRFAHHVVVSGNIRDIFPAWSLDTVEFFDLIHILQRQMADQRSGGTLIFDTAEGMRWQGAASDTLAEFLSDAHGDQQRTNTSLKNLLDVYVANLEIPEQGASIIVDYASHLPYATAAERDAFFVKIDKASRSQASKHLVHPTMIWLVDQPADLPDWFVVGNDLVREVHVELPNLEDRFLYASRLQSEFSLAPEASEKETLHALQQFALECDGDTLTTMRMVAQLANEEDISLGKISDAIRVLRTGLRRNPWRSKVLAERVKMARSIVGARIKGQGRAIEKTLDILARSIIGLSGAQSSSRYSRPRGVLFLAGPTGVGKTEMAKAVTELLFGDESACHRFDMSEFMEEDSISRLLGAPPGHPGHERGGELVNAAHRRPFSVFLFDEIEKAHPRVLDVFLQLIDEGRLSDSRGSTGHFSEALIIFTSNIGVMKDTRASNHGMNVLPSDTHEELVEKILYSVQDYFRVELRRPELLNRIGQNIVVFDFLTHEAAVLIFDAITERVVEAVRSERGIHISLSESAREQLMSLCLVDFFEGGRGIANRIEDHFINPLAREIFEQDLFRDAEVRSVVTTDGRTRLMFE